MSGAQKAAGRYMHGKTCAECASLPRCRWLVQALPTWMYCDWAPPRFTAALPSVHPASAPPVATVPPGAEAPAKSDASSGSAPHGEPEGGERS